VLNDEAKLIKKCLRKNPEAQRHLYEKYRVKWFMICLRYSRSRAEAEDMLQEGLISVFNNLKQFDIKKAAFSTWSSKVMVNAALQNLRKWKKLDYHEDIVTHTNLVMEQEDVYQKLGAKEITEIVSGLPEGYRVVFNLYVVEGYKHKEIADMLGISENTSKSQLRKAKIMLRDQLEHIIQYK
jgi:RNA polymerase sigma-70 factor (ECF subfamily)